MVVDSQRILVRDVGLFKAVYLNVNPFAGWRYTQEVLDSIKSGDEAHKGSLMTVCGHYTDMLFPEISQEEWVEITEHILSLGIEFHSAV